MKFVFEGCSHILHMFHSLPYTQVLGFVACKVTSKRLVSGAAERSLSEVKMIKDGKRSKLSGDSLEKHAILYTSAHLEEARICSNCECCNDSGDEFTNEDIK